MISQREKYNQLKTESYQVEQEPKMIELKRVKGQKQVNLQQIQWLKELMLKPDLIRYYINKNIVKKKKSDLIGPTCISFM